MVEASRRVAEVSTMPRRDGVEDGIEGHHHAQRLCRHCYRVLRLRSHQVCDGPANSSAVSIPDVVSWWGLWPARGAPVSARAPLVVWTATARRAAAAACSRRRADCLTEGNEQAEYIIRGTPGGIQYFGVLEDHCYWGNEVKLYERHVDALFAMFWHKKLDINYYVCTINKTFAKPGKCMYFQVHYTEENLLDYIDPHNDTLMVRLANGRLLAECGIMLGIDKRATVTTYRSEFRRRTNKETFALFISGFEVPPCSHRTPPLDAPSKRPQVLCE